jgi:Uma2 family endonuclease
LLKDSEEYPATRFTYDKGRLKIMVVASEHEAIKDRINLLVNTIAEVLEIDIESFGSTTFKRQASERGFEPDACFYIQHEAQVMAERQIDLSIDPPS